MPIGKNGNGQALLEGFIPDGLSDAATSFVESLKINTISQKRRRSRLAVIKRRNILGERGADLINFYFSVAGIPIRYLSDVRGWRRWEANLLPNAKWRSVSREDHRRTDDLAARGRTAMPPCRT